MNTTMKIKTITDGILAAIVFVVVSCVTATPQVESPPGKYEIWQKDERGQVVAIYQTTSFKETIGKDTIVTFVDSNGTPRTFKSYDIFKP